MNRPLLRTLVLALLFGAWLSPAAKAAPRSRLYLTFVSHNEDSSNALCAPVNATEARYLANRAALLRVAQTIYTGGGAYDMQADWEWISKTDQWETDDIRRATTFGQGIIQLLATAATRQIRVDAHSHEHSGYNYADVVYMLQSKGAPPTGIVGGFISNPASAADWVRFRAPLTGQRYPGFTWQATTIWGGGSGGHADDQSASGVWRPKSPSDFFTDDSSQTLFNIGNGASENGAYSTAGAVAVFTKLQAGQLEQGRMYTASLMLSQCDFDTNPAVLPFITGVLAAAAPYVASGDVLWAPLPEMARIWREEYGSQAALVRLR